MPLPMPASPRLYDDARRRPRRCPHTPPPMPTLVSPMTQADMRSFQRGYAVVHLLHRRHATGRCTTSVCLICNLKTLIIIFSWPYSIHVRLTHANLCHDTRILHISGYIMVPTFNAPTDVMFNFRPFRVTALTSLYATTAPGWDFPTKQFGSPSYIATMLNMV
uniref:Uncharacterized protein n=1 Tax=Panagrellus redivivus TaxID=6233 RepID=A0A7E4ZS48_PANRE